MWNSVDPDETAHYEPSHLDLCCLLKPIIIACGGERLNSQFHINIAATAWTDAIGIFLSAK